MAGSTIDNLVTLSVTLGSGAYPSPLTITPIGYINPSGVNPIGATGLVATIDLGSVLNEGTVAGGAGFGGAGGIGVDMASASLTNVGSIAGGDGGDGGNGCDVTSSSVTNNGTIAGGSGGLAVGLTGGAGLAGTSSSVTNDGLIAGGYGGVGGYGSFGGRVAGSGGTGVGLVSSTLTNQGTIAGGRGGNGGHQGSGGYGGTGVSLGAGSSLANEGMIRAGGAGSDPGLGGPDYRGGGLGAIVTDSSITNDGTIAGGTGGRGGAGLYGNGSKLTNNGLIVGGAGIGPYSNSGGLGVDIVASTLTNDGTIVGSGMANTQGGDAVHAAAGSVVTNTGMIAAGSSSLYGGTGVLLIDSTLTNVGTILAGNSDYSLSIAGIGVVFQGGGTLIDAGFIGGGVASGAVADAVSFGTGASRLVLDPGATFAGEVVANAAFSNVLELASAASSGAINGIGSSFAGFGAIAVDPRATWVATGSVSGSGTIGLGAGSNLKIDGGVAATRPVEFTANVGTLGLADPGDFAPAVYGFQPGDGIDFTSISSTASIAAGVDGFNDLTLTSNGVLLTEINLDPAQSFAGDLFHARSDGAGGTVITDTPLCFLVGTLIATPSGAAPIEQLHVGDLVATARGEALPIVWIGTGRLLATRGRRNAATPVVVRKGALADNVPYRDLRVTRAHALGIDGALIPVEFLVNHRSIHWDDTAQEVALFHIELARHDVLLANGAPAESYRDDGNRWLFHNANSGWHLPAKRACAPVLTGGHLVDDVWRRLLERAGPRAGPPLTDDPDLHLLVDGRRIDVASRHDQWQTFNLTGEREIVRIVSNSAAPQESGTARDPRCLGVALRQIIVRQGTRVTTVMAGDATLTEGFHEFEPDDAIRWTNGDAVVPAVLFDGFSGAFEVLLCLGGTTSYVERRNERRVA